MKLENIIATMVTRNYLHYAFVRFNIRAYTFETEVCFVQLAKSKNLSITTEFAIEECKNFSTLLRTQNCDEYTQSTSTIEIQTQVIAMNIHNLHLP